MRGYASSDIAEHCGTTLKHVNYQLNSAAKKISGKNTKNWGNYKYEEEFLF